MEKVRMGIGKEKLTWILYGLTSPLSAACKLAILVSIFKLVSHKLSKPQNLKLYVFRASTLSDPSHNSAMSTEYQLDNRQAMSLQNPREKSSANGETTQEISYRAAPRQYQDHQRCGLTRLWRKLLGLPWSSQSSHPALPTSSPTFQPGPIPAASCPCMSETPARK